MLNSASLSQFCVLLASVATESCLLSTGKSGQERPSLGAENLFCLEPIHLRDSTRHISLEWNVQEREALHRHRTAALLRRGRREKVFPLRQGDNERFAGNGVLQRGARNDPRYSRKTKQ